MRVFNNIEYIQINLSSKQDRYYLPENSAIFGKKIDEIAFYTPESGISPIDGTPVMADLSAFYLDVVKATENDLHRNVSCTLSNVAKNLRLPINTVISPNLSSICFIGEDLSVLDGKCIIMYVTYDTVNRDVELSTNQVTVSVNSSARRFSLNTLIDYYLVSSLKRCKAIEVQRVNSTPFYLDFKSFDDRAFRYIPADRLTYNTTDRGFLVEVEDQIVNKMFLNDFNFDFDNCFVINGSANLDPIQAKIIFYY